MSIRFFSSVTAIVLLSIAATAQQPPTNTEQQSPVATDTPSLKLRPVPPILRLHFPMLGQQKGVLVESVEPGSAPEKAGFLNGDVLLEAGGMPIVAGVATNVTDASFPIVILRRGRTQILNPHRPNGFLPGPYAPRWTPTPWTQTPMFAPNNRSAVSVSSSSVSSGSGGQSVSISRAGDMISLEISMPGETESPIRLQGTAEQIERQLREGNLEEAAKRQVRSALGQVR